MEFIVGERELGDYKHRLERLESAKRMTRIGSPQASQIGVEIGTVKTLIQAYETKVRR